MIIGINGRMRSGKDTVAQILIDKYSNVRRVAFADLLKDSAAAAIGVTRDELDQLKLGGELILSFQGDEILKNDGTPYKTPRYATSWSRSISGRQYLQYYGTEAHRELPGFGDDVWIRAALDKQPDGGILVVTDMRFPNELEAVKMRSGITVKVLRPEVDSLPITHPSEQTLPDDQFDYFITNDGSMELLEERVDSWARTLQARGVKLDVR